MIDESLIDAEAKRLAVLAAMQIDRARKAAGLKKSELAERLGIPRSRVTRVLDGQTNMTLHTLAQFGLASGVHWTFVPNGSVIVEVFPGAGSFRSSSLGNLGAFVFNTQAQESPAIEQMQMGTAPAELVGAAAPPLAASECLSAIGLEVGLN